MSNVVALYHIVFCTKCRSMTMPEKHHEDIYRFIWSQINEHGCRLLRIGGTRNHIHILVDVHPKVAVATLVANIKARSSGWMRHDPRFPNFEGWGKGYFAASVGPEYKDNVITYIRNQKEHHCGRDLNEELAWMSLSNGVALHESDLT